MIPIPSDARPEKASADCYSGGERAFMERGQALRARALGPFLRWLGAAGVRPDHLTLVSFGVGLLFCPLWFVSPVWALAALLAHVLLDGVDGPLARHLGIESARGSFTDSMADQAVVTASTVTLIAAGAVGPVVGSLYIYVYLLVVAMAMVRNALDIPYSWLVRPRLVVYAWMAIEAYAWRGSLDWVLWLATAALGVKAISGFVQMRRGIPSD